MPARLGAWRLAGAWLAWAVLAACQPDDAPPGPSPAQAQRIVTLAPHLTELAYAAGAGRHLVGTVAYSDYPEAAAGLPRVGDAFRVDYESLAALKPDLVLGWSSGNPVATLQRLRELGYRVVELETQGLDSIARQLLEIGRLAGTRAEARRAATAYREALDQLRRNVAGRRPVRVFYQVAAQPLTTVTDRHVIGEALQLCGGINVFGEIDGLVPVVSVESVLHAAPEAILASDGGAGTPPDLAEWRRWASLPAAATGSLFAVPADLVSRPGPRMLDGVREICKALQAARERLDQA